MTSVLFVDRLAVSRSCAAPSGAKPCQKRLGVFGRVRLRKQDISVITLLTPDPCGLLFVLVAPYGAAPHRAALGRVRLRKQDNSVITLQPLPCVAFFLRSVLTLPSPEVSCEGLIFTKLKSKSEFFDKTIDFA